MRANPRSRNMYAWECTTACSPRDHAIPEGKRPKPKVVRRDGGSDIAHANSQRPAGEATSGGRGCLGGAMLALPALALGLVALGAAVLAG